MVPEQMAYMEGILRTSTEYDGGVWEAYDIEYGRQGFI